MTEINYTTGDNQPRKYYFFWMIAWYAVMFFFWIGAPAARPTIDFYIKFSVIPAFIIITDIIYKSVFKKSIGFLDTTTIDKPKIPFLTPRVNIVLAFVFAIVIAVSILKSGTAFIDYPHFSAFDSTFGNSLLSAIVILPENFFFFNFLFPTLYKNFSKKRGSIPAFLLAAGLVMLFFMLYHIWIYHASASALFSTIVFAGFSIVLNFTTGFAPVAELVHISNNFVASMIDAAIMFIFKP